MAAAVAALLLFGGDDGTPERYKSPPAGNSILNLQTREEAKALASEQAKARRKAKLRAAKARRAARAKARRKRAARGRARPPRPSATGARPSRPP